MNSPLHNFRTGLLPPDDHPAFNVADEKETPFLNAFRGQNLCRIHCLLWLTHSLRRGKLLEIAREVLRHAVHQKLVSISFDMIDARYGNYSLGCQNYLEKLEMINLSF